MRGAIAAGHPVTTEVGARVLAEGGNAVDAAVAACFASWVAESPLTGPGGGGFMLVHRARDRTTRVLDFFVSVPRGGVDPHAMETVDVDFSGETATPYLIGAGSAAVPGVPLGLETAWKQFGTKPWAELLAPALALAHDGVELNTEQDYLHEILSPILRFQPEGRQIYDVRVSERIRIPQLARTLELLADEGAATFYTGTLARELTKTAPQLTRDDLAAYRVVRRRPVATPFRGCDFYSNPPPSSGGVLIAYGLRLLDEWKRFDARAVVDVLRKQASLRDERFLAALYRGGLARRLIGTTHISVVDAQENAVSVSCSTGAGSGVFVPGTGVHLNNMLGESDLFGLHRPGARLTSMMSPSLALADGRPRLVVGSAGSARLRAAITQVVVNVLARGLDLRAAVEAPRLHWENGVVHAEPGAPVDELAAYDVQRWQKPDLFFGGANAVELRADGSLAAAGDPRRGGVGAVVE